MTTLAIQVEADPGTMIRIFDTSLREVAMGHTPFTTSLPNNSYLVRGEIGDYFVEATLKLSNEQLNLQLNLQTFRLPTIRLPVVAPIESSKYYNRQIALNCNVLSQRPEHSYGKGSQLFICLRGIQISKNSTWHSQGLETGQGYPDVGLSLLDSNLNVVTDHLSEHLLVQEDDGELWSGCTFELNPGLYFLTATIKKGIILYQPILLASKWQTQVFLKAGNAWNEAELTPELCNSSIYMKQIGTGGFESSSKECRLTELLIAASPKTNPVVNQDDIANMAEAYADPTLILHALYYSLTSYPDSAIKMSKAVLPYLANQLGDISDIRILRALMGGKNIYINTPPLLSRAWSSMVKLSFDSPALVPRNSLVCKMAGSVWGWSPWLIWLNDIDGLGEDFPFTKNIIPNTNTIVSILSNSTFAYPYRIAEQAKLTHIETSLLVHISHLSDGDQSLDALAKALNVPQVSIERGLNDLVQKILGLANSKREVSISLENFVRYTSRLAPQLEIVLVKSLIGCPPKHRRRLTGLGLRRINQTVIRPNSPQVRGLVNKLEHLLRVKPSFGLERAERAYYVQAGLAHIQ